jgi:hypothetical protein
MVGMQAMDAMTVEQAVAIRRCGKEPDLRWTRSEAAAWLDYLLLVREAQLAARVPVGPPAFPGAQARVLETISAGLMTLAFLLAFVPLGVPVWVVLGFLLLAAGGLGVCVAVQGALGRGLWIVAFAWVIMPLITGGIAVVVECAAWSVLG